MPQTTKEYRRVKRYLKQIAEVLNEREPWRVRYARVLPTTSLLLEVTMNDGDKLTLEIATLQLEKLP